MLGRFGACAKMACASHPRRDGGSGSEFSRACTKLTISCAGIVYDTTKRIIMGNNSVRFRFKWDIIGTVKLIIGLTSSFLHNLSSFLYRMGARVGRRGPPSARGGFRWQCVRIKKAAGKGSMLFPAARPGRHLQRRRPESFLSLTPLAEARSALGVHPAPREHSAHQEPRPLRPPSAPRLREPRRARRTAGISRRSRHRIHSGTSCKSVRPSSSMLV